MTIVYVPEGEEVVLRATLSGDGVDGITQAVFTLYRMTDGAEQVLETVNGVVGGRRAKCTWTARGNRPAESLCSVYYRVVAGPLRTTAPDEIVVFRNRLEVTAVKDLRDTPQPGALCCLRVAVDPSYTPPENARPFPRERVIRANANGLAVFDNLPPGRWEVTFRSPFDLVSWPTPDGWQRKAVVHKLVRARFTQPDPATLVDKVHRQWVNLTEDPTAVVGGHPDRGPVLKVKAKVIPDNGPGRAGDAIYLRAVFGTENSLRNDPAPSFEGTAGGKGVRTPAVKKTLDADDGEVEFTVHLGMAGGDAVTLELGGTPACEDAAMVVVNWRRLFIKPVRPRDYVLPNDVLPTSVSSVIDAHLKKGFIEAEFEAARVLPDNGNGYVVPAQIAAHYPVLQQGQDLIFFTSSPEKPLRDAMAPRFPPRLYLVLGHVIAEKHVETHVFNVTARRSDWRASKDGYAFYPVPFDGTDLLPVLTDAEPERPKTRREIVRYTHLGKPVYGEVETGEMLPARPAVKGNVKVGGTTYPLGDDCVEVHEDTKRFRLLLPDAAARAVSSRAPGSVTIKVTAYSFKGGSSTANWVSAVWSNSTADLKGAITILHEIGHSLGLAPSDGGNFPGLPATHAHTYGLGAVTDQDEHGHQGPHCAFGLSTGDKATPEYSTLVDRGRHGSCIMFGGTGARTRYPSLAFCEHCAPYLRATRMSEV